MNRATHNGETINELMELSSITNIKPIDLPEIENELDESPIQGVVDVMRSVFGNPEVL